MDAGRFEFGANWRRFLEHVDEDRVAVAASSLADRLLVERLDGLRFLDAGCGSGLFSLAARRMGAVVHSFDYDVQSVECTRELQRRFMPNGDDWMIEQGSVLDGDYMQKLGQFDVVYSWGVLHHTGSMWEAIDAISRMPVLGGRLFVSIYNDQGQTSRRWTRVKRLYCESGSLTRWGLVLASGAILYARPVATHLIRGSLGEYRQQLRNRPRGMSAWFDLIDWVGGYPFEVARPEEVFEFLAERGYRLLDLKTCGGGLGCNEFVLEREREVEVSDISIIS